VTEFNVSGALFYWRVTLSQGQVFRKLSCADVSQTRALDHQRFMDYMGKVSDDEYDLITDMLTRFIIRKVK
jgi:mRNA-degrading endonuclease toxin of MazEF toxin-antitoxin module